MPTKKTTMPAGMSEDTKSLITVLLLIFAFPVGLLVMWFWVKWRLWVKLLISVPILILVVLVVLFVLLATVNPSAQIEKAECVRNCRETTPDENCSEKCVAKTINKTMIVSYPKEAKQEFAKSCLIDFSQSECSCAIDYLESNLSYEDYLKVASIDENTPKNDPRVTVLDAAFNKCVQD